MHKKLLVGALLALSSVAVLAQTAAPADGAPVHKVKKHRIKHAMNKVEHTLKEPHAPAAGTGAKP